MIEMPVRQIAVFQSKSFFRGKREHRFGVLAGIDDRAAPFLGYQKIGIHAEFARKNMI